MAVWVIIFGVLGIPAAVFLTSPGSEPGCQSPSSFLSLFLVGVARSGFLTSSIFFSLFSFLILSSNFIFASMTEPLFMATATLESGLAAPMVNLAGITLAEVTFLEEAPTVGDVFLGMGIVFMESGVFLAVFSWLGTVILPAGVAGA